jgi:hypothetical protein
VWNFDDIDTDGSFQHTVVVIKSLVAFYYVAIPFRLLNCRINKVLSYLKVIPTDDIFPPFPVDFTKAFLSVTDNVFYKRPRLLYYGEQKDHAAKALLREAGIYEKLR